MQMEKREIIQDELEQLAPSLRLQQKSTLQVPSGYFEELPGKLLAIVNAEQKKRSTLIFFRSPQWKVLAAAAL